MSWAVFRPKTLRSPPDSVHLPPARVESFMRTPIMGLTLSMRLRSMITSSSLGISMTRMHRYPSMEAKSARSTNSSSL